MSEQLAENFVQALGRLEAERDLDAIVALFAERTQSCGVGGVYYGIPAANFAGWLATSFLAFALFSPRRETIFFAHAVGASIVLFFTLAAVAHALYLPALVGGGLLTADFLVYRVARTS